MIAHNSLQHLLLLFKLRIIFLVHIRESPLLRINDFLPTRELVRRPTQTLSNDSSIAVLAPDRHDDLSNVDTCNRTIWLAPSTTHARLKTMPTMLVVTSIFIISIGRSRRMDDLSISAPNLPISSSTGQHLVDTKNVVRMHSDPKMERVLARRLGHILVGTDTSRFKSFTRQLFILVRHQVTTKREFIHRRTFPAQVENVNLGVQC